MMKAERRAQNDERRTQNAEGRTMSGGFVLIGQTGRFSGT